MSNSSAVEYELSGSGTAVVVFRMLIYVIGVLGNLLVIFVILYLKEYKKITHWYVLQMALADIIFLQNLPVKVTEDINNRWVNAEWLCSAYQAVLFFTYYASILFLIIMAIDRYLAVCHTMSERVRRVRSIRNAYIVSAVTWIVALCCSIPAMMYGKLSGTYPNCKCTLMFPLDAHKWCSENGYSPGDPSFDVCVSDIFPAVNGETCVKFNFPHNTESSRNDSDSDSPQSGDNPFLPLPGENPFLPLPGENPSLPLPGDNSSLPLPGDNPFLSLPGDNPLPPLPGENPFLPLPGDNPFLPLGNTTTSSSSSMGETEQYHFLSACHYDPGRAGLIGYIYFNFAAMFLMPFLVLVVCYGLIVRRLVNSNLSGSGQPTNGSSKKPIYKSTTPSTASATTGRSDREKTKVTILCFLLATIFTVCWLPFHAVHLARVAGIHTDNENFCKRLGIGTSLLAYFGSAINPYLYNFLGSFKKRIRQIKSQHAAVTAVGVTRTTRASSAAPSSTGPRPSLTPSAGPNSIAPPEEIPLREVGTRL